MDNQTFDTRGVATDSLSADLEIYLTQDSIANKIAGANVTNTIEAINIKAYNAATFNQSQLAVKIHDTTDNWDTNWTEFPGLYDDPEVDSHVTFFSKLSGGETCHDFEFSDFSQDMVIKLRAQNPLVDGGGDSENEGGGIDPPDDGATTVTSPEEPGLCLDFDGSNQLLETTYAMESVTSFTSMFWIKTTSVGTWMCLVSDEIVGETVGNLFVGRYGITTNFVIYYRPEGNTSALNFSDTVAPFDSLICDGEWHHVAVVFDSSGTHTNVSVYVDGQVRGTQDTTVANGWNNGGNVFGTSATAFHFGGRKSPTGFGGMPFNGSMDEMAFFESALTSEEISNIYRDGQGGDLLTDINLESSTLDTLKVYYRVGDASDTNAAGETNLTAGDFIGDIHSAVSPDLHANQPDTNIRPKYGSGAAF